MNSNSFFVHESSYVDPGAEIGEGTKIWHFSHIMGQASVGKNCNIGQNVFIGDNVRIGNSVKIQNNVSIYSGVIIEDLVFLGPSMVFTNVINPRSHIERKSEYRTTRVKHGSTIGANVTVICGVNIGRYAFVGAGSVVTYDVPNYGLVYGNPSRLKGWICQCGERLNFNQLEEDYTICTLCGNKYSKSGINVHPA